MHKRLIAKLAALDIDRLQEAIDYDPVTGALSWRIRLSPEEAFRMAFDLAKQDGWTAPRWWQWWRWHEVVRHDIKSADT